VIVISVLIGITKACGKSWLVTRTWVRSSSISRSAISRMPYSVCSTLMIGLSYSRKILRHRHIGAGGGAAELLAIGRGCVLVLEEAMQERRMRRIDADFQRLQPVAVDVALECKYDYPARRNSRSLEMPAFAFAQISPEDAALLNHG